MNEIGILGAGTSVEAVRRALEFAGAAILLLVTLPLQALVALLIRLDSPGPVFYRQPRLGKGGRRFEIVKFRSMHVDAAYSLDHHLSEDPSLRMSWERFQKMLEDPRLTRPGRWLRQYSIDELPQLWNVLKGEMSLIGPRPIFPDQRRLYGPAFQEYVQVRPGMTGLWQVSGRNRLSFAERVELDQAYIRHRSLRLDLKILVRTLAVVVSKNGAF